MKPLGAFRIYADELEFPGSQDTMEIVIPYTEWALGVAAMDRASALSLKLSAAIRLIAVHAVPYPVQFGCPAAVHANLVEQLVDLASRSRLAVHPQVILARSRDEGFRAALPPESAVLLGTRRRLWKTPEERLAQTLAAAGHKVALFHVE
jgi:acetyl esterase/lipase